MVEAYPNMSIKIGDLYVLKEGLSVDIRDVLVKTGNIVNGKEEVDKMSKDYNSVDVIGISMNRLSADYKYREITVLTFGPAIVKVAKEVVANQQLQGSTNRIYEEFSGDGTEQQQFILSNVPVDTVVLVYEKDGSTTLTEVSGTPTTNQYSIDKEKGIITIGGTSVSETDNYQITYDVDSGRLEPFNDIVTEELIAVSDVGTTTYDIEEIEYIETISGSNQGSRGIIVEGTPSSTQVKVDYDNNTITFASGDSVSDFKIKYKTKNRACARALESKSAGELCRVLFDGVKN